MGATCSNCAAAAFLTTQLSLPPHLKQIAVLQLQIAPDKWSKKCTTSAGGLNFKSHPTEMGKFRGTFIIQIG